MNGIYTTNRWKLVHEKHDGENLLQLWQESDAEGLGFPDMQVRLFMGGDLDTVWEVPYLARLMIREWEQL